VIWRPLSVNTGLPWSAKGGGPSWRPAGYYAGKLLQYPHGADLDNVCKRIPPLLQRIFVFADAIETALQLFNYFVEFRHGRLSLCLVDLRNLRSGAGFRVLYAAKAALTTTCDIVRAPTDGVCGDIQVSGLPNA
jgi:hypothetical protein